MNVDLPGFALTGQTPRYAGLGWSMGDRDQGSSDCASPQQSNEIVRNDDGGREPCPLRFLPIAQVRVFGELKCGTR
jgi:hypothetical protein